MGAVATEIMPDVTGLSDRALEAFCEDMTGMFDVEIRCARRQAVRGTVQGLREQFKKLAAVHSVQAEGALNGVFHLLFDPGGVFVLGGVIVMLPELRIREGLKHGTLQDVGSLQDAAREAGNLLVGSWDRVFREECPGHKHFVKTGSFIGKPWEASGPQELQSPEPALTVLYDMTIEPYPSFTCAVVFPDAVLEGSRGAAPAPAEDRQTPDAGPKAEDGGPRTEAGGQKIEDRGQQQEGSGPGVESVRPSVSGEAQPGVVPAAVQRPVAPALEPVRPPSSVVRPGASVPAGLSDALFLDPAYIVSASRSAGPAGTDLRAVPVAQIMEKDVVWATPDETVQDVLAKMQQHNTGYVLVGRDGRLEGLVSSSNILGAVSLYLRPLFARWRRPEDEATLRVKVQWIMSRPVRTIRPDAPVAAVIENLRRCGGRCLPVVDAAGTVQGLVTVFDLLLRLLAAPESGSWQGRPPQAPALLI